METPKRRTHFNPYEETKLWKLIQQAIEENPCYEPISISTVVERLRCSVKPSIKNSFIISDGTDEIRGFIRAANCSIGKASTKLSVSYFGLGPPPDGEKLQLEKNILMVTRFID